MNIDNRTDLGLTGSAGCACCAPAAAPAPDAAPAPAETSEVLVSGMTCSHCVASVTNSLSSLDGVERVSVDLNRGGESRVTIRSSSPLDESALRTAIDEAGYTLSERH